MSRLHPKAGRLYFPLLVFVSWLATLTVVIYFGFAMINRQPDLAFIISSWDGGWHQSIASQGYILTPGQQSNVAFFPVYAGLVWLLTQTGLSVPMAALAVSLLSFATALCVIYLLAERRFNREVAQKTVVLLAVWPGSFFFGASYTESLFLLLTALALLLADQRRWWWAAVAAGLASGTRIVGVLLAVVIVGHFLHHHRWKLNTSNLLTAAGLSVLSAGGLITYMTYLYLRFGNPLAFIEVQKLWPGRGEGLSGFKETLSLFVNGEPFSNPYALGVLELAVVIIFGLLTIYCFMKIDRWWALLCAAWLAIPLSSGTTISMNRYVLVLIPCFIALALITKSWGRLALVVPPLVAISTIFLIAFLTTATFVG